MMRILISGTCLAIIFSCAGPAGSSGFFSRDDQQGSSTVSPVTYLDTVNRGNEVAVFEEDQSSDGVAPPVQSLEVVGEGSPEDRFRVQIFAATRAEALKEEKESLKRKTPLPMFISFEQPYYKLYIGDFSTRDEAESNLPALKKLGYPDAWIVRTKKLKSQ